MPKIMIAALFCVLMIVTFAGPAAAQPFTLVENGRSDATIVADQSAPTPATQAILDDAANWLADAVAQSTGAKIAISDQPANPSQIVIARVASYPEVARNAGLTSSNIDAFCIVPEGNTLFILGNSEVAARHGVATLLRNLGFRYYNPSPNWWHVPELADITIDKTIVDEPDLNGRRVFYNYGRALYARDGEADFERWQIANRLGSAANASTGHSYDNIINRNMEAFARNHEYYALDKNGQRNIKSRKFCYSNDELRDLVLQDRIAALEEARKANPYAYMINIDPSDGDGTCHCDNCAKIGSSTDRVFSLANHVAKGIREKYPEAWVGLYAYASHRLPPNIDVEKNVYVQVAMAFNDTDYSYDELIDMWGKKSGAIGIREYWGIEAWDWGLPGRMRVTQIDRIRNQLRDWEERGLDSVNAESGNWGAQTPGMFVATQLMWDLDADVDALLDEYYRLTFEDAAEPMRELQALMDAKPPLDAKSILPLYEKAFDAFDRAKTPAVRDRVVDMLSYLHYVLEYRRFAEAKKQDPKGGDVYYNALEPLMTYAWRTRYRGMKHQYALARRLCNGYPIAHKRYEFYMFDNLEARLQKAPGKPTLADVNKQVMSRSENDAFAEFADDLSGKEPPRKWPIWKHGEQYTDAEIIALCRQDLANLKNGSTADPAAAAYVEPTVDDPDPN